MRCWFWLAESDASAKDDIFLQRGDELIFGVVYLRRGHPAPSEQRRAGASAYRSSTLMISRA